MIPRKLRDSERPAGRQPTVGFLVDTVSHAPIPLPYPNKYPGGLYPKWAQVVGSLGPQDQTITVDCPNYFSIGDVVKVARTGEAFRVAAVGPVITAVRGIGSTKPCPLNDRDDLLIIGSALPGVFKSVTS